MEIKEIRRKNLLALLQEHLFRSPGGKASFAEKIGIPPSQLSQLTSDKVVRNVGDVMARRIEANMNLPHGWMDSANWDSTGFPNIPEQSDTKQESNFLLRGEALSTGQKFSIDVLDTEFSCGNGRLNPDYPEVIRSIEINPDEAKQMFGGRKASSLKIVTAVGDSMLGSINPGDLVVLDVTAKGFIGDGIYGFVYGETFHIKRLQLLKDRLIVISDNGSYERWEVTDKDEEQFRIQGFVVGKWRMDYTRLG